MSPQPARLAQNSQPRCISGEPARKLLRGLDLVLRHRLELAHLDRGHQNASVARQVHRQPHELEQAVGGGRESVAAHQHHRILAELLGHVAALVHVDDQEIRRVAEFFVDIPDRDMRAHVARHVGNAAHRRLGDAKRQNGLSVGMDHGVDVRPRLIDGAVDIALQIGRAYVALRRAVELELDDVRGCDELGAERPRQQIMVGLVRMADADVAVGVDHLLLRQNPVGDHQIADRTFQFIHAEPPHRPPRGLCFGRHVSGRILRSLGCARPLAAGLAFAAGA
jgi:hypothetical protein